MKIKKNKYNHHTEDFRREAVRRSDDANTSAAEVAKELGIHPGQIYLTTTVIAVIYKYF